MNLNQLCARLKLQQGEVEADWLQSQLAQLDLNLESPEIAGCLHFDSTRYSRNLYYRDEHFEMLLLCFESGQRTPIHDHAGSVCGVKVLAGTGVETLFERTPEGWLFATGSRSLSAGGVVGSVDMDTHQLSNLQPGGQRLVTLHVYSPPLGEVGNYSLVDNQQVSVRAPVQTAAVARPLGRPSTAAR